MKKLIVLSIFFLVSCEKETDFVEEVTQTTDSTIVANIPQDTVALAHLVPQEAPKDTSIVGCYYPLYPKN